MTEHTTPPRGADPTLAGPAVPSFGGVNGLSYVPVAALCEPRYNSRGVLLRQVWKYRDVANERDVAVKLIPTSGHGELVAQIERAGAVLTADIPGVAALLDHERLAPGTPYERLALITEFVTGTQLDKLEPGDPERAVRLARSLATTVSALHAAPVVHGDIKPSNVIVRASDGQPILVDAGSARRPGERLLASSRLWEPPEAGAEPRATPEYDCWSLGLVFATLLGFRPDADQTPEARGQCARAELDRLASTRRDVSAALQTMVTALLEPSPAARATAPRAEAALEATPARPPGVSGHKLIAGAIERSSAWWQTARRRSRR